MKKCLTLTPEDLACQMAEVAYKQGLQDGLVLVTELLRIKGVPRQQIEDVRRVVQRATQEAVEQARKGFLSGFATGAGLGGNGRST
jgi:hypothetical protein